MFNLSCLATCYRIQTLLNVFSCSFSRYMGLFDCELMQSLIIRVRHMERDLPYCLLHFSCLFFILEYLVVTSSNYAFQ